MVAPRKVYEESSAIPESVAEALRAYTPIVQRILFRRGITNETEAERFMNPSYDDHLHNPFLLTDMEKAVDRLLSAVQGDEHIVIYTDYDCDGIPGGVLLHDFFTAIGFSNFENYIPHRHDEGYGFNANAVDVLKKRGASLIVTVDCGITDHEAVARANELSIDVIVTDHHEPGETLPPACAVINPKRDDRYPFKGICGAAVAYKLAQATLARGRAEGNITLKEGMEKWWLDLVGLATIADMVPLVDENRVFARYGLSVLRKSQRPGLQQLLRKAGGSQRHLTEDDIGFTIAPRINAASRMDDPEDAFHMLRTKDEAEAGTYVFHLEKLNNERKGVVGSMVKEVRHRLNSIPQIPEVIVMGNPEWRPSLVGLVANSLAEDLGKPTFLWGRDGKGIIKGSCRSGGDISVVRLMERARDAFLTFGGHHASGGFSVSHERIHTLQDALLEALRSAEDLYGVEEERYIIDTRIRLTDIDEVLIRTLETLGPFGMGNPKPVFLIEDATPDDVQVFGKVKNHTKLKFVSKGNRIDAIAFFKLPEEFTEIPIKGKQLNLLAHIERSHFMGRLETRLRLIDVL